VCYGSAAVRTCCEGGGTSDLGDVGGLAADGCGEEAAARGSAGGVLAGRGCRFQGGLGVVC
jgi:hypothetical protein